MTKYDLELELYDSLVKQFLNEDYSLQEKIIVLDDYMKYLIAKLYIN